MSFGYFSFNFAFVQVFRSSAIYFGIVCILGVSFNLGILLLYLSTKKVVRIEILCLCSVSLNKNVICIEFFVLILPFRASVYATRSCAALQAADLR